MPGLAAKPVIDILAGVESMRTADELLGLLCEAGYDTSKEFNATLKDRRWLMLHENGKRSTSPSFGASWAKGLAD